MSRGRPLILTYHAIEPGPPPLCLEPQLLRAHLDVLADAQLRPLTVAALGESLTCGELPERTVVMTFDDGFASVAEHAAPLLAERRWPATVFAVAGHLGGSNDWPSQPSRAPRRRLATAGQLGELVALGWEVGSHGVTHQPLGGLGADATEREIAGSRRELESRLGVPVRSFAYPYGVRPGPVGLAAVRRTYAAACTGIGRVGPDADLHLLPRVDAHYLRSPALLRRVVEGNLDAYLHSRRLLARVRRLVRADYVEAAR